MARDSENDEHRATAGSWTGCLPGTSDPRMTITSGRVIYSRTVQPAQHESERAEVELAFAVEDGHPAIEVAAAAMAEAKALILETVGPGARKVARSGGRFSRD